MNGPVQKRTIVLDVDYRRANEFPDDYDTDLESQWSNLSEIFFLVYSIKTQPFHLTDLFIDDNDFSWENIQHQRNKYQQKKLANEITIKVQQIIAFLTSTLHLHLNIGQYSQINTSQVFMSMETLSVESLSNKLIQPMANAQIRLPEYLSFSSNTHSVSLRVREILHF